jgi:hypothetical protein
MAYNLGEIQPGAYVIKAKATAAITKGYFVVITPTSSGPTVALSAGAKPTGAIGVALDAATAANQVIRVCIDGMVSVQCDDTGVDAFDFVSSDANGKAEVATIGTDYVVGIALDAGAAKGVALIKLNQIPGVKSA